MCKRVFFRKLAGQHPATSLRINFFTDNFQGFRLNEHRPMAISRSCAKCLKSTCEIVFILYILLKILPLVHETNSFAEVFCKKDVLKKKIRKLTCKHKKQSSEDVLPKRFSKKFRKIRFSILGKHLHSSLFLVKFQIFSPADLKNRSSSTDVFL